MTSPERHIKSLRLFVISASMFWAASLFALPAQAQSNDDGWVPLESLARDTAPQPSAQPDSSDNGWIALEDLDQGVATPTLPQSPNNQNTSETDGWQDLESFDPSSTGDILAPEPEAAWMVIEDEIAEVTANMVLPNDALSAGDLVDITVADVDNLSGAYRISALGTLILPLIGSVEVEGLTAEALAAKLTQLYGVDYLVNPKITVGTREKIIGAATLTGLIGQSGDVPMTSVQSLADVLVKAGGVIGERMELDAIILRDVGIGIKARRVPLDRVSTTELPGPTILPGDQIRILKREKMPEIKDDSGQYPLLDTVLNGGSLIKF